MINQSGLRRACSTPGQVVGTKKYRTRTSKRSQLNNLCLVVHLWFRGNQISK
jgi:hypothetical protein